MNTENVIKNGSIDANSIDSLTYIGVAKNLATIIKNSVTEVQLLDIEIQLLVLVIQSEKSETTSHTDALLNQIIIDIHRHRHPRGSE
ncbi:hypothetical protein [Janthinobacterium sp. HLS12-2]|uniref:hypothetical protein n=1 Tax=Janthinobacterium sp. HLS12-2 TaxID=1259324 RepID=UPI003F286776